MFAMKGEMAKEQMRLLNRATLIPIVLIFFLATLLISIQHYIFKVDHLIDETDETINQVRITRELLSTMESNYNSYVVTRRQEFLQNYLYARNELPENLVRLKLMAKENGGYGQFKGISRAFKAWVVHSESLFGKTFPEGVKIFESTDFQRVGNMHLNALRSASEDFINKQLRQRDHQLKETIKIRRRLLSIGVTLFFLVATYLAWYFRHRLGREFLKYEVQAKRLRESRKELRVSLKEREEALKSRDEFIKIASHELNTPLQSLLLQAQMLKRDIGHNGGAVEDEKLSKYLSREVSQVNRLSQLVQDMLAITRLGNGVIRIQRRSVKLSGLISEVLEDLHELITSSQSDLTLDLDDSIEGHWDHERLGQVLSNLITNALKYGRGKPVTIRSQEDNGWAHIEVEDQGLGITQDSQRRIFERFERNVSSNEVSGLGLGLYISRELVHSHGGRIWVESAGANLGSVFVVEIPLTENVRATNDIVSGHHFGDHSIPLPGFELDQ
jgi:signal transduction histidine kinase